MVPSPSKIVSDARNLQVLYEDNHVIVVNKRAGDIVQGDKTGDVPLSEVVKEYLKEKYDKPGNVFCGVTHRLDRPTTGLVVFAKTSKALERLNRMFQSSEIHKTYLAIVPFADIAPEGTLIHFLKKDSAQNRSKAYQKQVPGSKRAVLHYKRIARADRYMLLEVDLETGRHHQIRSQLSAIGLPIKGDLKYGSPRSNDDASICLHAYRVRFIHPVSKQPVEVVAPSPSNKYWDVFSNKNSSEK